MKTKLLSGIALSAVVTALSVATTERAQAQSSWTGSYVGAFVGGAWGRSKTSTAVSCNGAPGSGYICDNVGGGAADAAALNASGTGKINGSGVTGGIQAGYLWQDKSVVYGVETDFGAFDLGGTRRAAGIYTTGASGVPAGTNFAYSTSFDTNWLWTMRGRVGWVVQPNLIAYATGGLAVTRLAMSFTYTDTNGGTGYGQAAATKAGWTLGGGLEWAFNRNWSVKVEYLYLDFGKVTANGTITTTGGYSQGISTSADLTAHIARLGVNYKF